MYAQLVNNLDELGFTDVEPYLSEYLTKASKDGTSILDALIHISDREISLRNHRAAQIQVSVSHFPYIKTLDEFDYHFQPSVNRSDDVTEEIFAAAYRVFDKLWDKRTPIRQIGVGTTKVQSDAGRQYNLFDLQKYDRLEVLNKTIDEIRGKFGEDAVKRACFLKSDVSHLGGGLDKERRSGVTIGIDVERENTRIL